MFTVMTHVRTAGTRTRANYGEKRIRKRNAITVYITFGNKITRARFTRRCGIVSCFRHGTRLSRRQQRSTNKIVCVNTTILFKCKQLANVKLVAFQKTKKTKSKLRITIQTKSTVPGQEHVGKNVFDTTERKKLQIECILN